MVEYDLIRSKRKTLAIYVKSDGSVEVRAPIKISSEYIDDFVAKKKTWIEKARHRFQMNREENREMIHVSPEEIILYKKKAVAYMESRCPYFAEKMGVEYNRISINKAKTRWGSCSAKGNINFTYRLLFAPQEAIDYVIVHELAHLKEMNHSKKFWSIVEEILPDYKQRRKLLREHQMKVEIVEAE